VRTHVKGLGYFFIALLEITALESTALSAGWLQGTARSLGATLYRQPTSRSETLGRYPAGTPLKVYSEPRDGFYSMYFQKEFKGTHYVWISADEIDLQSSGGSSFSSFKSSVSPTNTRQGKNRIRFGANYGLYGPSEYQIGIGDTASSFGGLGFHADYERRFSKLFAGMFAFDLNTYTQATSAAVPGGSYFTTGYSGMLGVVFYILNKEKFTLSTTLAGGMSIYSAGNGITTTAISTQNIIGFPFLGTVNVDYRLFHKKPAFFGNLWIFLKLGYQIQSLSLIPIMLPSAAQSTANISLNAPIATLGLQMEF